MGGIISRLARQVLLSTLGAKGPSVEAIQGKGDIVRSGDKYLAEDKLSEQEIDLLCGVYRLESQGRGKLLSLQVKLDANPSTGHQPTVVSWFPRSAKWFDSGYSVGQWTHECETWFQAHVREIQAGVGPYNQNVWRTKLRQTCQAPKLVHHMNLVASAFIEQQTQRS